MLPDADNLYPSRYCERDQFFARVDPIAYVDEAKWECPDSPITAEQTKSYVDQGYLLIENLFSEQDIAKFQEEALRLRHEEILLRREETIIEPGSSDIRSIFDVQRFSSLFRALMCDMRIAGVVSYLLDCDVYLHQSRLNFKPGFRGKEFYWHSDFETWHVEDGMPNMRAISVSIALTDNFTSNGPVMLIPGSHRHFVSCAGYTPADNYKSSLRQQQYGVPSDQSISTLVDAGGISEITGRAGSVLFFDCNLLHGSASNISPYPRSNLFMVYNAIHNQLRDPYCEQKPRPEFIARRSHIEKITPLPTR